MSEEMPSNQDAASEDVFARVETILKELQATATPPPAPAQSWLQKTLNAAPPSAHQGEFNKGIVEALAKIVGTLRETAVGQEARLKEMAAALLDLRTSSENLDALRQQLTRLENESRSVATSVRGLQERAAALETELAQAQEKLAAEQGELRREVSERIQHLLDEQRVCIRQLSLQASEEAVLADRARRATELKLEEFARRISPPPA